MLVAKSSIHSRVFHLPPLYPRLEEILLEETALGWHGALWAGVLEWWAVLLKGLWRKHTLTQTLQHLLCVAWFGTNNFPKAERLGAQDSRRKWWRWRWAPSRNVWLRKREAGDGAKQAGRLIGRGTGKVQEQNNAGGRENWAAQMSYDEVQPPEAISLASLRSTEERWKEELFRKYSQSGEWKEKKKDTKGVPRILWEDCFDQRI